MTHHGAPRARDNARARKRALKAKKAARQQRSATAIRKAKFDATHARAVRSLQESDYEQFDKAIQEEMAIIKEQRMAIQKTIERQKKKSA
jgi:ribosomal protein S13